MGAQHILRAGAHHSSGSTYVVQDTFTGADATLLTAHTGEVGATWTKVTGVVFFTFDMAIDTGRVRGLGDFGRVIASGVPATAEYDVLADLYVASLYKAGGLVARCSASGDATYLVQYDTDSLTWQMYSTPDYTLLGSYAQTLTEGQTYAMKFEVRDAAKKFYVDGVERISSATNAITAKGAAGLQYADANLTTGLRFDNFLVVNA